MALLASSLHCSSSIRRHWNAEMKQKLLAGDNKEAILAYVAAQEIGFSGDNYSFPILFKAASNLRSMPLGCSLHCQAIKTGYFSHPFVQTALINLYSDFSRVEDARRVFDKMGHRDIVAWNSMLDAYAGCCLMDESAKLFDSMPLKDQITFNIMANGHAISGKLDQAEKMFVASPDRDTFSWNLMISSYLRSGQMDLARKVFGKMPQRDLVSWNTMINGYVQNESYSEALELFEEMQAKRKPELNHVTLTAALSACSQLGQLQAGAEIHIYAQELGLSSNSHVATAIMDMYSKCGRIEEALKVFYKSPNKDIYCWNSMISGLALQGQGEAALKLFDEMPSKGVNPDSVTFLGLLSACTHAGLVYEGLNFFNSMEILYNTPPKSEHYGCVVDLLSRAGRVNHAYRILESMPFEPGTATLGALLSACVVQRDSKIGDKVATRMIRRGGGDMSDGEYMLLVNFYAASGRWHEARSWRKMMNKKSVAKEAGCSSIVVDSKVHKFLASDISRYKCQNW